MTVLRSREVVPINQKPKPVKDRTDIEPATPSQNREAVGTLLSPEPTPVCRRSARLASKSSVSGDEERVSGHNDAKRKRKLDVTGGSLGSEGGEDEEFLSLRLGRRLTVMRTGNDGDNSMESEIRLEGEKTNADSVVNDKGKEMARDVSEEGVAVGDFEKSEMEWSGDETDSGEKRGRFTREEKGKAVLVDEDTVVSTNGSDIDLNLRLGNGVKNPVDTTIRVSDVDDSPEEIRLTMNLNERVNATITGTRMEQFREIARENASRFALFGNESEMPAGDVQMEIEDWPGPFSTAMKIIRDRTEKLNRQQQGTFAVERCKNTSIKWIPKSSDQRAVRDKISVPSLKELSLKILVKNADAIASLENVPDTLRHKLSQMLCDSRGMNTHFFDLLVMGSPTEIRLRDCSWLTEKEFSKSFEGCDSSNLTVLQLDRCGRCLPDYTLLSTIARSLNSLPSLTTLSLCGACRLSDDGLRVLTSSAPALRCLNLGQCSLLTSTSIDILADSLGSVLQELYINDCQRIDAMLILPALKKLNHLEVLSVAGIETVSDDFVGEFMSACGHNMKELVLSDCLKLTDFSLKVIAETCPGLCTLDISNLCKLTDFAIGYLANGCRAIQTLKLCRNAFSLSVNLAVKFPLKVIAETCPGLCTLDISNFCKLTDFAIRYLANGCRAIQTLKLCCNAFSDEAIAAFLETSGESLKELSLNNLKKVAHNTALSLAKSSRNLINLDLSWCRLLTNDAMGLIVDSCLSLRMVKLFGCTQITNEFLDRHSNPEVKIIGLKMSPVLEHLKVPDPEDVPMHYFSVLSSL
ncbi:hypothetical protein EZV62_013016 [Acer yangbiense]|uniref:F-box/LRR-repeat protein 15-like leucin rich repeat domain-containing protein n=1 Tax=Acer yangbiense TaxID=1000413 RepID=A0A5C7HWZ7_9ROSI|nr:hypothetical protein EZV62_013016 [Acer yangbiense]